MSIKKQIAQLVQDKPKHFSQMIPRNPTMWEEVKSMDGETTGEKVYLYLNTDVSPFCERGNRKKFSGIDTGYRFCGRANQCDCARESVAKNVSAAKGQYTQEKKQEIHNKRVATTKQRYGVTNVGQTAKARQRHSETYSDRVRVHQISQKIRDTKTTRHGDPGFNNQTQSRQTCLQKYGVESPMKVPEIAQRSARNRQKSLDPLMIFKNNFQRISAKLEQHHQLKVLTPAAEYRGLGERPRWKLHCQRCDLVFHKRIGYNDYPQCPKCSRTAPVGKSQQEMEIYELIRQNSGFDTISGDRMLIAPFEIDIVIPEIKLAVEFCGLYWHSENSRGRTRLYHRRKMDLVEEQGYRLVTIFSDEYEFRKPIVERTLLNLIGKRQEPALHARKCDISEIDSQQANQFHEKNHIQGGYNGTSSHWALISGGQPVMVMSFRKTGEHTWELSRMSSCACVRGGATRLFKSWAKATGAQQVTTFADLRWSQGDVYQVMGFQQAGEVPPVPYYVLDYSQRVPKRTFSKARLVAEGHDPKHSEWEILQNQGVDRIWDCGKIKYQWSKV